MAAIKSAILLLLGASLTQAAEYHLSLDGSDRNVGTVDQPIRTFAHAVTLLKPGDALIVRGGRYTEPLVLKKKHGKADRAITIRAAAGEKVVLDGTDALDALSWSKVADDIYKARLDQPIWQLFADDLMMTPARWPNAHMTDDNFFRIKETSRMVVYGNSPLGTITDTRPRNNMSTPIQENHFTESAPIRNDRNLTSLVRLGRNVQGAIAVMNIGSWMNFASRVTRHEAGSRSFQYDASFSEAGEEIQRITDDLHEGKRFGHFLNTRYWHPHFYFLEGLPLLDAEKEYWYEQSKQTLYYRPANGVHPRTQVLRGKRRSYMLELQTCTHIHVVGIDFFGATFHLNGCSHTSVEDSNLYSPSWNQFQIGNLGLFPMTRVWNKHSYQETDEVSGNRIVNCRFSYLDGIGIRMMGKGNVLENCLFHDLQYSNLGFSVGLNLNRSIVRNCTLYRSGAPEGFRDGMVLDSNRAWAIGGLAHDGSCFQLGGVKTGTRPTVIRNNWVHDTSKIAYRYDAGKGVTFANALGMLCNNVSWNSRGMQIKGDDHLLLNNTILDHQGLNLNTAKHWMSTNDRTIAANNLMSHIDGAPLLRDSPPGVLITNKILADSGAQLRDPKNLDFRPKADSVLLGTGTPIPFEQAPDGYFKEFFAMYPQQDSMDVGAYASDFETYNIPGFRTQAASTPVPPNGSTTAQPDADLMWLTGYKSTASKVYFGISKQVVAGADESSPEFKGTQTTNIYTPSTKGLAVGARRFWRIDSVREDGSVVKGPVWSFQVDNGQTRVAAPPKPRLMESRRGGPVAVDGVLEASEWPQLDTPDALQSVHLFGDRARTKVADFAVQHDDRHLYLMARIPNLGQVIEATEGRNHEGFHTAWEVQMKWDNDAGPLSSRTFKVAVFPDGTIDPNVSGFSSAAAQNFFGLNAKPLTHAVVRQGDGMTVEMKFKLSAVKRFFKSESNRIFFNVGIVINSLPCMWAAPLGKTADVKQDGVLVLQD